MYNIGITLIGYEAKEHLEKVLAPWKEIKEGAIKSAVNSLWIGAAHACFVETFHCGYPIRSKDGTIESFEKYTQEGLIDHFILFEQPVYEFVAWNSNLPHFLEKGFDLCFMLNTDEIWEVEEVQKLMMFIKNHPEVDYFKIRFKNYVFNYNTYVEDFIVPRIWRINRNGGIKGFHYDDELTFLNGKTDKECPHLIVPKDIAFPKHFSWVGSKEFLQRKLKFQTEHYKKSSYKWDNEKDCLAFDLTYYELFNKPLPKLNFEQYERSD